MIFSNCLFAAARPFIPAGMPAGVEDSLSLELKPVTGLTERVWLRVTPDGIQPYEQVADKLVSSGIPQSAYDILTMRMAGVCVEVVVTAGQPLLDESLAVGMAIPSAHLFAVVDENFQFSIAYCEPGAAPSVWICLALLGARS